MIPVRVRNLTGQHFGRLVATEYVGNDSRHQALWRCACQCGNTKIIKSHSLVEGATQSCGCLRKEYGHRLPEHEASRNVWLGDYKRSAERRGYAWEISDEHAILLFESRCFYCGVLPEHEHYPSNCRGPYICNGIDRYDNAEGYTLTNSIPCCPQCNSMKQTMPADIFLARVHQIARFRQEVI